MAKIRGTSMDDLVCKIDSLFLVDITNYPLWLLIDQMIQLTTYYRHIRSSCTCYCKSSAMKSYVEPFLLLWKTLPEQIVCQPLSYIGRQRYKRLATYTSLTSRKRRAKRWTHIMCHIVTRRSCKLTILMKRCCWLSLF